MGRNLGQRVGHVHDAVSRAVQGWLRSLWRTAGGYITHVWSRSGLASLRGVLSRFVRRRGCGATGTGDDFLNGGALDSFVPEPSLEVVQNLAAGPVVASLGQISFRAA
jgi:hypothetical protein